MSIPTATARVTKFRKGEDRIKREREEIIYFLS
jgi:hypothetical protein